MKFTKFCICLVLVSFIWISFAHSFQVTLTDQNSSLQYDTQNYGAVHWTVDGTDNLFYESYFFRVGNGPTVELLDGYNSSPVNGASNKYGTTYDLGVYGKVRLTHTLNGDSTDSYMSQWITSLNFTSGGVGTEPLYFYTYSDYNLSSTRADETVSYLGSGEFSQYDNLTALSWSAVDLALGLPGIPYSPDHYTTRGFNNVPGVPSEALGDLNDSGFYYGDAIFMAQWNNPVDYWIVRSISPVPEPSTFLLLGGGLIGLAFAVRRRKKE